MTLSLSINVSTNPYYLKKIIGMVNPPESKKAFLLHSRKERLENHIQRNEYKPLVGMRVF